MPTPGYVFKDGGPLPDDELATKNTTIGQSEDPVPTNTFRGPSSVSTSSPVNTPTSSNSTLNPESHPSESHAIANANHDEKGAAQHGYTDHEVKDLGWNNHPNNVPKPLVGGLPNEELWLLVRRFNKQMYHVKAMNAPPPGGLDLNIADEDEFSPDKLRANIERLYMTVIIGLMGSGNHIARLRSWREPRRTAAFCAAYFIAWIFNFIVPLIITTLIVLIAYPPSRHILFPPAPLALVDRKTGGIQSPPSGVLGSHDSATGAPEKHKGEAVENEASNFVAGFAHIALSSASGKHEASDPGSDPVGGSVPDPTNLAQVGADAKDSTSGNIPAVKHDKTKQPVEEAMWSKMRPIMHVIGDISDGWERFGNALSPTPPFPQEAPRLKLAGLLVPVLAISMLTTSEMFMKMNMFFVGFGFFADPIIWRAASWLNRKFPNWQKLLEIRNTILKGVPTNAQLTLTLLRVGEANKAPLPPPPTSDQPPSSRPASLNGDDLTLDASNDEIHDAIHATPAEKAKADVGNKPKHHTGSRVLNFLKGTTKAGVEGKLGLDSVRAKIGSESAKQHLGILPKPGEVLPSGPVDFKARYQGKKGWIYINTSATIPCVSFSKHASDGTGEQSLNELELVWSVPIEDIREIKKIGGLGWKSKIVVGWATDKTVADGLEIVDRMGTRYKVTAIGLRDELFNRLLAMGTQKWESW